MTKDKSNSVYRRTLLGLMFACLVAIPSRADAEMAPYDPLAIPEGVEVGVLDLAFTDTERRREIPIRLYLPEHMNPPVPVVLFSHGLGGSREGSRFLGEHWAARGYAAVFLQHPGSDRAVWENTPRPERMDTMERAANLENFLLRADDVHVVLDQLEQWNEAEDHVLAGRLQLDAVGMSGHSFGAVTTQAASGQRSPRGEARFTDDRIAAAVLMSPSAPRHGSPEIAFGEVSIPWLLMTGTHDTSPIGDVTMESRLAVYPALPPGGKYELVLHEAEHSIFTEVRLPGETMERNPNHHPAILALSTAFWDAWLRDDPAAMEWLNSDGPESVLEPDDRWQRK